jgi:hypothetical protein
MCRLLRNGSPQVEVLLQEVCSVCTAHGDRIVLAKCPICHKLVCETCRVMRGGRSFCSQRCSDYFFFDDED